MNKKIGQNSLKLRKINKKEKGITLIALVTTIIILLILVGVTVSQLVGENGLIQKAKEAVERYKNASEQEQIQLGELEQYVSEFSIVGGNEGEGEKALVGIKSLEVKGDVEKKQIEVKVIVTGEARKVQYSIDNGTTWVPEEREEEQEEGMTATAEEEVEEEKETEYTYTFEELALGKSYFVRIKVYDVKGKYIEAISDIVTLSYLMTAQDGDVLREKTYLTGEGTLRTGTMPNNGEVNETLKAGDTYKIKQGYYSGGTITAKVLKDQTSGDAGVGDILSGKKAWVNGALVTGTMTNNGKVTQTLNAGGTYTIQAGYYSGGTITAKTLKDQTGGTAGAGDILKGKTAYVNGNLVTGTIENFGSNWVWANSDGGNKGGYGKAEYTYSDGSKAQMVYLYTRPGYTIQSTKIIVGTENEIKNNTLQGKTFLGVAGTATSDATAGAGDILTGKTAYVKGAKVSGSMANKGAPSQTLDAGGTYTIQSGYYSGGTITAKSLKDQTSGTAGAGDILSGKTAYVNGNSVTGSMTNNGGKTVDASSVSNDGTYTTLTIPSNGYYNTSSKIRTLSSNLTSGQMFEFTTTGTSRDIIKNIKAQEKILILWSNGTLMLEAYDVKTKRMTRYNGAGANNGSGLQKSDFTGSGSYDGNNFTITTINTKGLALVIAY